MVNNEKLNCWEFKKCGREPGGENAGKLGVCPAALQGDCQGSNNGKKCGRMCWLVGGTFCGGRIQGDFAKKVTSCMECDFFKKVKEEEGKDFKFLLPGLEYDQTQKLFMDFALALRELELYKKNLEELNNVLEKRVEEKTKELDISRKKIMQSEKMAALGQLAGGVAHEINNPMTIILGYTQIMERGIKEDSPLFIPVKAIEKAVERCRNLIGSLLTFSRIEKKEAELTDINSTVEQALALEEVNTRIKNVRIIREFGEGLQKVFINKNQIQQVIINLCTNAADAMPEGGTITVRTRQSEDRIEVEIRDTGKGMTEEIKKHIFEPFFTTKEVGKGTGLGLSLCYEIIQKHNGQISLESSINQGTTFNIKLPLNVQRSI
ncbi:MAG: hypothetical protein A2452_04200 [Candidatus Firestonebacteria bacterium RIFOXYC2_FULL_39_67]|nr:MAG: hypothetical protein A2536_08260 [Candidatus Firestonebacteria bacterium RIFOXYD2_FULL_39_29]OGF57572.1 MAG: hypothetical protein A2452_04200 [Candidatus Firestonebacteria bacterium RIFOXYC2_FULL_39_67]